MKKAIPFDEFQVPAYDIWDQTWFLLTCGDYSSGKYNTMTVAWGSFGNMWNLPLAMVVVRPTRFTFEFINRYDNFTLCAFPEKYKKVVSLLGSKSGRDTSKISESGLTLIAAQKVSSPVFTEADLTIECHKMYWNDFMPEHFLDDRIHSQYEKHDYHRMFFGEILAVSGNPQKYSIHV
jgi:flavin reductase (DIM6/NTAB) family NADH-FMN oxidoreductase RutF